MNSATTMAPRWAVSTRTHGEVLAAGVATPALELVLLGAPDGFTPLEIEGWLRDLAGVSMETSRVDERVRAIPPLLHHALTGLLFSQAELWSRLGGQAPTSAAFVDSPECSAFGWVGAGRAQVLLDGVPVEPNWVRVRDDDGREARAATFPLGAHVRITLDWWPDGDETSASPAAVEAEWSPAISDLRLSVAEPPTHAPSAEPQAPAEPAAATVDVAPLPDSLTAPQPGLAGFAGAEVHDAPEFETPEEFVPPEDLSPVAESAPVTGEPDEMPLEDTAGFVVQDSREPAPAAEAKAPAGRADHPIGRWLGRLMGWGQKPDRVREPEFVPTEATPVSRYDSLLSDSVPASELAPEVPGIEPLESAGAIEQTAIEFEAQPSHPSPEVEEAATREEFAQPEGLEPEGEWFEAEPAGEPVVLAPPSAPEPEPVVPEAAVPEPAPVLISPSRPPARRSALAAAGLEEMLGALAAPAPAAVPAAAIPPRAEAPPPAIVNAPVESADPSALPVLSPELPGGVAHTGPIKVEHEPVGAHQSFAIPRVPMRPAPKAPLPGRVTPTPLTPAATPLAPPVLRIPGATAEPVAAPATKPDEIPFAGADIDLGDGLDVEHDATPDGVIEVAVARAPTIARPVWPAFHDTPRRRLTIRKPWAWAAVIVVVFGGGWLLGGNQGDRNAPGGFTRVLRAVGLGGARFIAVINSTPTGAWIAVDGKDLAQRTPATIEVQPGPHTLSLSLPDLGAVQLPLRGRNGERVTVEESLNGQLEVMPSDAGVPINVSLDGKPQGYAPVTIDALAPGLHEVQFSGPGMPAWAQTVQIGVRRTEQLIAHPMSAPGTGVIQVAATLNDETGSSALPGATVRVDGELRGATPLTLELPRGPHSLKLSWHGETAPVQVIELPGGNERHASFAFGLDSASPSILLANFPRVMNAAQTPTVSATLTGLQVRDVREAWLHVRAPEGLWRRYAMTMVPGGAGAVATSVFPPGMFDSHGQTRWYVSASTLQGDEFFSEMQAVSLPGAVRPAAKPGTPPAAAASPAPTPTPPPPPTP